MNRLYQCPDDAQTTPLGFAEVEAFEFGESVLEELLLFSNESITMLTDDNVGDPVAL